MKLFTEILNEPYSFKWIKKSMHNWSAEFVTEDRRIIEVSFQSFPFYYEGIPDTYKVAYIVFVDKESGTRLTGKGDAFKIIATVIEVIKDYLKQNPNIYAITFSSEGDSRTKLYRKLIKSIARKFDSDWIIVKDVKRTVVGRKKDFYTSFVVVKKKNKIIFNKMKEYFDARYSKN